MSGGEARAWKVWLVDYHAAIVASDLDASARWLADVAAHRADNETGKVNLRRKGMSARKFLAELTGLGERTITRKLSVLEEGGWVRREGERRGGSYFDLWVLPRAAGQSGAMPSGQNGAAPRHGDAAAGHNGAAARHGGAHVFSDVFSGDSSSSVARDARGGEDENPPTTTYEFDHRNRARCRGPHRHGHLRAPLSRDAAHQRLLKHELNPSRYSSDAWEAMLDAASLYTEKADIKRRAEIQLAEQASGVA